MDLRYIPSLIMLVAGAITCIMAIVRGWDVTYSLVVLLVVLVVFWLLGIVAQKFIIAIIEGNAVKKKKKDNVQEPEGMPEAVPAQQVSSEGESEQQVEEAGS